VLEAFLDTVERGGVSIWIDDPKTLADRLRRGPIPTAEPADILRLLMAAGSREITIKGGFDGREFTQDGEELVVEAA
jgi:hypothetical protein